ncbi:MAG: M48 family metallopeptidase [Alphaproteobacteria bacterium]|nr:M48 family metallopeptidase [Alphaproteobacteria bacterium]MBV9694405.1 M48 family metallopeptidase [Alphaproteobacteria bacterium]
MRKMKATRKVARRELLAIEGRPVEVSVRLNPRARRLIVKVHPSTGEVSVVAPSQRALERAVEFARGQSDWIARQLKRVPAPVALGVGSLVPVRGQDHVVREGSAGRGAAWIETGGGERALCVAGHREHHARRLLDFLKREARRELEARTREYAARVGLKPRRLTVRDTASRWGSCSTSRSLSFSWRLILAPPFVLDYVVAHEVAHMREMNHGPAFWRLVREIVGDTRRPQKWLRDNGTMLHRYAMKG